MMKREAARLSKNNISLIEYSESTYTYDDKLFVQCGVVGFFLNKKDLNDLLDVLNYYCNIEKFKDCYVTVGEEVFSALPLEMEEE